MQELSPVRKLSNVHTLSGMDASKCYVKHTSAEFSIVVNKWSTLATEITRGQCIQTPDMCNPTTQGGSMHCQLIIYPNGSPVSPDGFVGCRLIAHIPKQQQYQIALEIANPYGKQNYPIFEDCVNDGDSIWDIPELISFESLEQSPSKYLEDDTLRLMFRVTWDDPNDIHNRASSSPMQPFSPFAMTSLRPQPFIKHKPSIRSMYSSIVLLDDIANKSTLDNMVTATNKNQRRASSNGPFLYADIASLFDNPLHSDITLTCEDLKIHAHKVILALRSPMFLHKFQSGSFQVLQMLHQGQYFVKGIEPAVCREMVRFIYSDTVNIDFLEQESMTFKLLRAAIRYQLHGLQTLCIDHLIDSLNPENVCTMLRFVDSIRSQGEPQLADSLYIECRKYVTDNIGYFQQHPDAMDAFDEEMKAHLVTHGLRAMSSVAAADSEAELQAVDETQKPMDEIQTADGDSKSGQDTSSQQSSQQECETAQAEKRSPALSIVPVCVSPLSSGKSLAPSSTTPTPLQSNKAVVRSLQGQSLVEDSKHGDGEIQGQDAGN